MKKTKLAGSRRMAHGRLVRTFVAIVVGMALLGIVSFGNAQASIPPGTNGKIVYGQVFPNYGFTINPDGSRKHRIGPAGSTTCNTFSPSGDRVLCNLWSSDGVPQPATANPDGSDFTLLNPNLPLDLFCLSWSPTGNRLLCHSEGIANPADAGLYTVRSSDAGGLVRVTATPPASFDIGQYGYSPDGSRILFARFTGEQGTDEQGTLFSVNPNGTGKLRLSPPGLSVIDLGFFDRVGADWSPDGSRVAFAAQKLSKGGFKTALFVVGADGTGLRQVTPSGIGAISAQWSPNGALIAFTSCCGNVQAWVVSPGGAGLRHVTNATQADDHGDSWAISLGAVWSPDSKKLLFNRQSKSGQTSLWTANVDGTGLSRLTDTRSLSLYAWGTAPVRSAR
jgi:Tol biopolymer transport system component